MDETAAYEDALGSVNDSIRFLLLFVLAVLLSLAGLLRQRQRICAALRGENPERCPSPYPLQHVAGAINVGGLVFFFLLALRGWNEARCGPSRESEALSRVNLWASLLVLAAAVLRLLALDASQDREILDLDNDLPA